MSVRLSGTFVRVQTDFGLSVRFDGNHHAEVSVPSSYFGKLCGLCGKESKWSLFTWAGKTGGTPPETSTEMQPVLGDTKGLLHR